MLYSNIDDMGKASMLRAKLWARVLLWKWLFYYTPYATIQEIKVDTFFSKVLSKQQHECIVIAGIVERKEAKLGSTGLATQ